VIGELGKYLLHQWWSNPARDPKLADCSRWIISIMSEGQCLRAWQCIVIYLSWRRATRKQYQEAGDTIERSLGKETKVEIQKSWIPLIYPVLFDGWCQLYRLLYLSHSRLNSKLTHHSHLTLTTYMQKCWKPAWIIQQQKYYYSNDYKLQSNAGCNFRKLFLANVYQMTQYEHYLQCEEYLHMRIVLH